MKAVNKSVLVTGCSAGGIGYALAEQFQKRGLTVFATTRTISKMDGLKDLPNTSWFLWM
jgi:short-subunit dehydrogenase